jgi:peptidoglycan/LPS O-acetylase OafA/YrhL
VAILFVLFHHFGLNYPTGTRADAAVAGLFGFMWCGVDLFFVHARSLWGEQPPDMTPES